VALFLALSVAAALTARDRPALWQLLGIAWVAFGAMALGAPLGARAAAHDRPGRLVWGYGLASGAMVTSAAVFLVPTAIGHHASFGGFGLAAGLVAGYGAHTVGHRLSHAEAFDHTAVELSAHALAAGLIIGVVYGNSQLGPLLGLAIVSHKGPAGYAAARRLAAEGRSVAVLLVPATGVGLTAIPSALVALPTDPVVDGLVFGFAAGVFLHVGMDFLPECEVGGEVHAAADDADHALLDRLRLHAVGATAVGGLAVAVAWLVVA
jgi:ZIP family zinc transporter